MFKNWVRIFTTDCLAVHLKKDYTVYPIFKNGSTSLFRYAQEKKLPILTNQQLKNLKKIKVFIRDPQERFISGVHTVIELEKITNVTNFLKGVECFSIYNRHFIPQFYWLMHLSIYFKGSVELSPINELYKLLPLRNKPNIKLLDDDRKKIICSINNKKYIDTDSKLIEKYIGQTIELKKLIQEFKNGLS